ncbi:hypothetical protein Thermus77420_23110 [Thermus thalpophilus]
MPPVSAQIRFITHCLRSGRWSRLYPCTTRSSTGCSPATSSRAALAISRNTSVLNLVQGVQHPAHAVIVQALRGDPRAQEVLGGLALEEVSKEVGRGDEAQGVQDGGLEGGSRGDLLPRSSPQPYAVHDARHQAQVGQVVNL